MKPGLRSRRAAEKRALIFSIGKKNVFALRIQVFDVPNARHRLPIIGRGFEGLPNELTEVWLSLFLERVDSLLRFGGAVVKVGCQHAHSGNS